MFLKMLRHTGKKEKVLIGVICTLFTVSYLTRTVYLVYEALFIED